jgi:hypothetical protein
MKNDNKEIELFYQNQAKEIIDSMFDCNVFSENLTRDNIQGFEDLIAFYLQSGARSAKKMAEFSWSLKKIN